MEEFKDRIKLLREEKGVSYTELGAIFGKTESAARAWELGRSKPDADTLIKLSQYFNCSTDYLLGLKPYPSADEKKKADDELKGYSIAIDGMTWVQQTQFRLLLDAFLRSYRDLGNREGMQGKYLTLIQKILNSTFEVAIKFHDKNFKKEFEDRLLLETYKSEKRCREAVEEFHQQFNEAIKEAIANATQESGESAKG